MARSGRLSRTLIYYDGPKVVVVNDEVDQQYLGLLVKEDDGSDAFLLTPMTANRLYQLETGEIDVRAAMVEPEVDEYYGLALRSFEEPGRSPMYRVDTPREAWIPKSGLWVSDFVEEAEVTREVATRGKAVVHLHLRTPEAREAARIAAANLSAGLGLFQNLVTRAYQRALRGLKPETRKLIGDPSNWTMDAYAISRGSFTVHLESRAHPDLLGYVGLSLALEKVDILTAGIDEPETGLPVIRENKGHLVSAYRQLLKFLVESDSGLEYQWSAPDREEPTARLISRDSAEKLYDIIIAQKDLTREDVTLEGVFTRVDVDTGAWTLRDDDGKHHGGRSDGETRSKLSGVTVDTQRYKVSWIEEIEVTAIGEVRTTRSLVDIEPL